MSRRPELALTLTPSLVHAGALGLTVSGDERRRPGGVVPPPPDAARALRDVEIVGVRLDMAVGVGDRERDRVDWLRRRSSRSRKRELIGAGAGMLVASC